MLLQDLQIFMDEASNGVIYVAFGSLLEPENMAKIGETVVKILAERPQHILFKWKPELLSNIPSNFRVQEWIPQIDILSIMNLFICLGDVPSHVFWGKRR